MCGRLSQSHRLSWREIWEMLGAKTPTPTPNPSWNIGPTGSVACVIAGSSGPEVIEMQFGYTSPSLRHVSGGPQFNARWERIDRSAKVACAERRCLVPVDGFYHWVGAGKQKQPFRIEADGKAPRQLLLAGVWERRAGKGDEPAVCLLTRPALGAVKQFHDRAPVIVPDEIARDYLDPERGFAQLREALTEGQSALTAFPVTPKLNRVAYSDDDCGEALVQVEKKHQLELL